MLLQAQLGGMSASAKPLHGLGAGVLSIAAQDASGAYRSVYTISIGEAIFVVHAFQRKSKTGVATLNSRW